MKKKRYLCGVLTGEIVGRKEKRFLLYPSYRNRQFQRKDRDNVTLILYLYMYEYASVVFRIIILIGVRILFLRSLPQGVWRCLVTGEQQDKSHAFLLCNLKENAELLGLGGRREK